MSKRAVSSSQSGKKPKAQRNASKRKSSPPSTTSKAGRKVEQLESKSEEMEIHHPDAAGIDIGSRQHWVCVPRGRSKERVRCFGATTPDLLEMAKWLKECGVKDVAMESTGMYWIPLYEILEEAGFRVALVDAHQTHNVCGRKTDQRDCEWIQQLHVYGLLSAAFRPQDCICRLRTLERHRKSLVEAASECVQHIQKALDGMNLHMHHVITDITGKSGMAMLAAIVSGERNPKTLAAMADRRVKKSPAEIEAALTGNYRHEELFVLKQALESYEHLQRQIAECDEEIVVRIAAIREQCASTEKKEAKDATAPQLPAASAEPEGTASHKPGRGKGRSKAKNERERTLTRLLEGIFGVNLTDIPGLGVLAVMTLLGEIGFDMSKWRNAKAFASWLGLCPNHKISGGRILSRRSRKVNNRAATALRMAALAIGKTETPLGCFYRRKAAQHGAPKAITATARKLACLIYHMVSTGTPYHAMAASEYQERYQRQRIANLRKSAKQLGYELVKGDPQIQDEDKKAA